MAMKHVVDFRKSGRGKAKCKPNPNYPNGIALDCSDKEPTCTVELPYPAPECGMWMIVCRECESRLAVTAAGRPDDPISVKMSCGKRKS